MARTSNAWPNKEIRDRFFNDFRELLDKYPHFKEVTDEDAELLEDASEGSVADGYPEFDQTSPMILQGVVIVLSYSNLEHFEQIQIIDPFEQSFYMTYGLLGRASTLFGLDQD